MATESCQGNRVSRSIRKGIRQATYSQYLDLDSVAGFHEYRWLAADADARRRPSSDNIARLEPEVVHIPAGLCIAVR